MRVLGVWSKVRSIYVLQAELPFLQNLVGSGIDESLWLGTRVGIRYVPLSFVGFELRPCVLTRFNQRFQVAL